MNVLRIAMIQMKVDKSKEQNIRRAIEMVKEVSFKGCNVVVLPEMFVCPYKPSIYKEYAEREGGNLWSRLSLAAKQSKVYLVCGSIPEIGDDDRLYNTSYVFDPLGNQIAKFRKMHLYDINVSKGQLFKESETITPGDTPVVFDTPYGKIGIALGYDIRFPELFRVLVNMGAKVVIIPVSFNSTTGIDHAELLIRARALDNQVFTVGLAQARDYGAYYTSYAKSLIADPWGRVVNRLGIDEGILIEDLDILMVDKVRGELPVLEHIREESRTIDVDRII